MPPGPPGPRPPKPPPLGNISLSLTRPSPSASKERSDELAAASSVAEISRSPLASSASTIGSPPAGGPWPRPGPPRPPKRGSSSSPLNVPLPSASSVASDAAACWISSGLICPSPSVSRAASTGMRRSISAGPPRPAPRPAAAPRPPLPGPSGRTPPSPPRLLPKLGTSSSGLRMPLPSLSSVARAAGAAAVSSADSMSSASASSAAITGSVRIMPGGPCAQSTAKVAATAAKPRALHCEFMLLPLSR